MKQTEYKDSGVEWIGPLPIRWEVKPAFSVLVELDERNDRGQIQNVLSLSYGKIVRRDVESNFGLLPQSFNTYQIVQAGDIVLRLLDLQNDHVSLRVGLVPEEGIVTSAYLSVRPTGGLDSRFAAYLLHAYDLKKVFYSFGGGCRQSMGFEDLRRLPIPFPPQADQQRIAGYLDVQTGKMDRLVALRRRQMELLREQRAALIRQAVTRGLNSNAPLKNSGLPWLGEIPKHWSLAKAKFLWREVALPVRSTDEIVTCFRDGQVTLRKNRREGGFTNAVKELGYQGIRSGQLVLHSMDAFAGAIGVSDSNGKCSPEYIICEPIRSDIHNPYFGYLIREMALSGFILAICPSVRERAPRIHFSDFGNMAFPIPPIKEQEDIVVYLHETKAKLGLMAEHYTRQLELLAEYRAALIHECVTGQRRGPN